MSDEKMTTTRVGVCPECSQVTGEVTFPPNATKLMCLNCDEHVYLGSKYGFCPRCGHPLANAPEMEVPEDEKVPYELCTRCALVDAHIAAEVEKGGVMWECN